MRLEGKRALVTGGTRGIGKAIVEKLLDEGARVAFTYRSSADEAKRIEEAASAAGKEAVGFQADAADFTRAVEVVDQVVERFGGLEALVNNAGVTKDGLLMRMSEEDFNAVVSANLNGVFNYVKAALKPMMGARYGRIVNVSSVVGLIGNPGQANYVASKAGIIGFTKSVARELAARNVTANVVAPGFVETDMTGALNDKQREAILSGVPMKKAAQPKHIADAVAFLASDEAEYVTGQTLAIDGGMTMQ
ncbi:MAG: 3-oxoacyl-[acyl-carrier-protein] reductase [Ignavibacteriales bacterium]|nr:3-oxoacyl-[acyl-carrier-protein] reductase [Ignavibacteriales bacterium]